MTNSKGHLWRSTLALIMSVLMVVTILPLNVFADSGLEMAPAKSPVGVKNAEGDIPSKNIGNDAPNAVHAFVGVQTGGDANLRLDKATGQQFKPGLKTEAMYHRFIQQYQMLRVD